jgi:hypothetical protein
MADRRYAEQCHCHIPAVALVLRGSAPQEGIVPGLTTKTTMVTHNKDGTWTAELSAGSVREPYPSSPSGWTPIDLTLGLAGARVARPWPTPT